MFGFDPDEAERLGSEGRFDARKAKHRARARKQAAEAGQSEPSEERLLFVDLEHYAWWIVHNAVAHPFLALWPRRSAFLFHDWTPRKLNAAFPEDE